MIFRAGMKLKSLKGDGFYYDTDLMALRGPDREGDYSSWAKSIEVVMVAGQMAEVPWAKANTFHRGEKLINLALVREVEILKEDN